MSADHPSECTIETEWPRRAAVVSRAAGVLGVLCGIVIVLAAGSVTAAERPNVLFLFADDFTYEAVHALGNGEIETPNLDRLVRRGTTFTHAYNQGGWNGAICVASRTMLVTGRYLWHAHDVWDATDAERRAGRLWPQLMKQAGYDTAMTGKWHIRTDAGKVFDTAVHVRGGMPNQTPQGYNRPLDGQPDVWSPSDPKRGGYWQGGRHWSAVVADDALGFLKRAARRDEPFFMYVAFNAPHDPRQSPQEYVDRYPLDRIAVPKNFVPENPHKEAMAAGRDLRDEQLAPFPRTERAVKVHRQEYYAIITHLDAQIGRILDALEQTGKADSTWIFFTADHGLSVGHHGLLGKQNLFDHSVRVPMIVVGPGVPANRRIDAPVYVQDVMPTTLELAGIDRPAHVEFHSLLPLLRGETETSYDAVYGAYLDRQRMVTQGRHKLILYPTSRTVLLFDLKDDPLEMHNLADDPQSRPILKSLFATLGDLQQQTGDRLDLRAAYPDLADEVTR